ncbi:MAG: Protein kinase domain [Pseudomonadota bacterium]
MTNPATVLCPTCGATTAPPTCTACQAPAWLDGRWALVRPQARGASATRWDGWDAAGARPVEVVSLNAPWLTPEARVRLLIEAPLWAGIEAPLATCVHGHGAAAVVHVVFAARTRPTLAERIDPSRRAPPPGADEIDVLLDSVAEALGALHGATPPRAWGALTPAQLVQGERWEIRAPIHALGVLADAGIPLGLEPDALAWQAPERLAGAPAHPTGDVYALANLVLALRGDAATNAPAERDGTREEQLWRSGWPPAVQAVVRACLAPEPARRPRDASDLLARLTEARRAPTEPGGALAFLDGPDRARDLADALAAPPAPPRRVPARGVALAAGAVLAAGLGWTALSSPEPESAPDAADPTPAPAVADTWETRLAALPADAPDSRVAELRGEIRAAAEASAAPSARARARAAEATLALRVGDDTGAWSAWREACATDPLLCAPLGHAIVDGRLGAATLAEGVDALGRACAAGDTEACARQARVEMRLAGPARVEIHDGLARACLDSGGDTDPACWRTARLDLAEDPATATARLGALCADRRGPACGWQAEGLRRLGDTAAARRIASDSCGDTDPHACVVLAQLGTEPAAASADGATSPRKASSKGKKGRKGRKPRAGAPTGDTASGPTMSDALRTSLGKACDAGEGDACAMVAKGAPVDARAERLAQGCLADSPRACRSLATLAREDRAWTTTLSASTRDALAAAGAGDVSVLLRRAALLGDSDARTALAERVPTTRAWLGVAVDSCVEGARALAGDGTGTHGARKGRKGKPSTASSRPSSGGAARASACRVALARVRADRPADLPELPVVLRRGVLTRACIAGESSACEDLGTQARQDPYLPDAAALRGALKRACDGEHPGACVAHGILLTHGIGGKVDRKGGDRSLDTACKADASSCATVPPPAEPGAALGLRAPPEPPGAAADPVVLTRCGERWDAADCAGPVAHLLRTTTDTRTARKARTLLTRRCEAAGSPAEQHACTVLGWAQRNGIGGSTDRARARRTWATACEHGHGDTLACRNLAAMTWQEAPAETLHRLIGSDTAAWAEMVRLRPTLAERTEPGR